VRTASQMGLEYLTLYAFSSENWKRPASEVNHLMGLFRAYFNSDIAELDDRDVRIRVVGNRSRAAADILAMIEDCERRTQDNAGLNLTFAFDYGAQEEILAATRALGEACARGEIDPSAITPEMFAGKLATRDLPDPDLILRTSGERRLSNFLLWQAAYAELMFTDTLWPDFTPQEFENVLQEYAQRERRFGALAAESVA
jgi:undecaprenyl diphosphate synthase